MTEPLSAAKNAARVVRVRLMVGVVDPGTDTPFVAGAMDEDIYGIVGYEESDADFAAMRKKYDPFGTEYEWREVCVDIDAADLSAAFVTPTTRARVVSAGALPPSVSVSEEHA